MTTYWSESTFIVLIRWTGLAPWEFEIPFPGSLSSTFLVGTRNLRGKSCLPLVKVADAFLGAHNLQIDPPPGRRTGLRSGNKPVLVKSLPVLVKFFPALV